MGKESDHIHIIALTSSLGVPVRVEYMDRGGSDKCNHHDFPEDSKPLVTLLYRPGHYDILYSWWMWSCDNFSLMSVIVSAKIKHCMLYVFLAKNNQYIHLVNFNTCAWNVYHKWNSFIHVKYIFINYKKQIILYCHSRWKTKS